MNRFILQQRYWPLVPLIWGLVVLGLFAWNKSEHDAKTLELASERAYFVNRLVEATRTWAARHGGIYAPTTTHNPPNPWLAEDERQTRTETGVDLTLINPAYMTRQLGEVFTEFNDMRFRITALDPINPENKADKWEAEQLRKLRNDPLANIQGLFYDSGEPVFRYMTPLHLESSCLQCHKRPEENLGKLRGAVSVAFPAKQLFADNRTHLQTVALSHFGIWLLLSGLTLLGLTRLRKQLLALQTAHAETEQLVVTRTAELAAKVQEHQQAAAQLQLFIDSSGEGIIGMDLEGRCTLVNPTALQLLGLECESQLLGQTLHDRIHHSNVAGQSHEAASCPMHGTITTGDVVHQDDDVFWRPDGSSFPVEYRSNPLFAANRLIGAVISFSDITERKNREQQLTKLSSAMEHSASSVVITSREGLIEYVNPHFTTTTGYSREEVLGQNPRLLQSGTTPLETYERLWASLEQGKTWVGELLNKRKDGSLFWEDVRVSPVIDDEGTPTHFIAIKEDITERKSKEQDMWHKAHFDTLTGLPNRSLMQLRLQQALERAASNQTETALLYVDLDGFKKVNDTLGHAAGDLVLKETARRLQAAVRKQDVVARLGGDEFVVILEQVEGSHRVKRIAETIVTALGQPFAVDSGQWTGIAASVGIGLYPGQGDTPELLLHAADQAMYAAKQGGGSGWSSN